MNSNTNLKKGAIWNTVAGIVDAAEAVVILMVITRTLGLEDAGIVTIAFSIGNLMMTLGKYGMRNYQVTDVDDRFNFRTYLYSRYITVGLMLVASVGYLAYCMVWKQYTTYKLAICMGICVIYMIESIEDVFWGLYQRNGRIDLGAKIFIARWVVILISICGLVIVGIDLQLAMLIAIIAGALVSTITNVISVKKYREKTTPKTTPTQVWRLLWTCLPLFAITFLSMYLNNASKYSIDRYMTSEEQACYGFIAMPVFVVSLLNQFIYQPILVGLAEQWKEKDYKGFKKNIAKDALAIVAITVICMLGAWLIGIPVLSWLYDTDLSAYRLELVILIFGSGFMAMATFISVVMTIMRIQKYSLIGYGVASVLAVATIDIVVKNYGILGACIDYVGIMLVLMVALGVVTDARFKKNNK